MAQHTGLRRVPALLTALAALVVLIGLLGLTGVLDAPSPATALSASSGQASLGSITTRSGGTGTGVGDSGASAAAGADGSQQVDAAADTAADQIGAVSPVALAGQQLTTATSTLLDVLTAPADDAATPAPVDPAQVPAATDPSADTAALPTESGEGRRAVYSINGQRVWLVDADGMVTRTYPVSGRLDRPGPGSYQVYSKSPTAVSYDYTETMQYMIRFAHGDNAAIGFHDIPLQADGTPAQTEAQLGQPLSAGCIRQGEADAEFLWEWAEVGTTVVVVA